MSISDLPFYNILNMFFVGMIFCVGIMFLFPSQFDQFIAILSSTEHLSLMTGSLFIVGIYFLGTVIDRLGSLVVEKLLKNKKEDRCWLSRMLQMTWKDYGHFQYAEKENDCIKILTREYTYSRNLFTALLILTCLGVACGNSFFCKVTIFGCLLFYLSMRKHANKIAQRVDFTNKKRQGGNP